MTNFAHAIATLLALSTLSSGASMPAAAQPSPAAPVAVGAPDVVVSPIPQITVVGADDADLARLDDALGRYRAQGLDLPNLEVRFGEDEADCNEHMGLFQKGFSPWRVLVCSDQDWVLVHELAHAWTAANMSDDERDGYMDARGLATWNAPDTPWGDKAVEDAAFMIQKNLVAVAPHTISKSIMKRIDAYELLTGQRSPLRADVG